MTIRVVARDEDSEVHPPLSRRRRRRGHRNAGLPETWEYPGVILSFALILAGMGANGFSADGVGRALFFVGCALFGVWGLAIGALRGRRYGSIAPGLWVAAAIACVAVIGWFQTLPFPTGFVTAQSPSWRMATEAMAAVGDQVPARLPLSSAPERTEQIMHQAMAALAFFLGALAMASGRRTALWLAGAVALLAIVEGFIGFSLFVMGGTERVAGGVLNPNHHAACVLMGLPVAIALAVMWRNASKEDPFSPASSGDFFLFLVGILMLAALGWLVSFSRASLAIGALFLTLYVLHEMMLHYRTMRERWGKVRFPGLELGLIAVGGIILLVATPVAGHLSQRFHSASQFTGGRTELWAATLRGFMETPIFGIGLGGTEYALNRLVETIPTRRAPIWSHNDLLQLPAEIGAVGIVMLGGLLAVMLAKWLAAIRSHAIPMWSWKRGMIARAALVGAATAILHSGADFPLRIPMLTMEFFALVALAAARHTPPEDDPAAAQDDD